MRRYKKKPKRNIRHSRCNSLEKDDHVKRGETFHVESCHVLTTQSSHSWKDIILESGI
jgi:hypothetical protein